MIEWPLREHADPKALRALAHPLRIRLMEELAVGGAATATEVAERVGESPANCSWHLRQLARYGYVEEAGGGTGRQRPWRIVLRSNRWNPVADDAELSRAGRAASEVVAGREYEELVAFQSSPARESREWTDASFVTQALSWLTVDELRALENAVKDLYLRHLERFEDPATRPAGARPVRLMAWGFPARMGGGRA